MIRLLAGILAAVLVGFPVVSAPTAAVGALGAAGGVFCAIAIARHSIPFLVAGASLSLVEYAMALLLRGGAPELGGAILVGIVVVLLFQVVAFAARFDGAAVSRDVVRGHLLFWLGAAGTIVLAEGLLILVAREIVLVVPSPAYPAVAALGVILAVVAVAQTVRHAHGSSRVERVRELPRSLGG